MLNPVVTPCPQCQTIVTLWVSNAPALMNGPYVSMVILQHPEHVVCPNCGTLLAPAIAGVGNLKLIASPVPPREEVKRILSLG